MKKSFSLVILGAGTPHHGEIPAALAELYSGSSILNWVIDSVDCPQAKITFVAGYQAKSVRDLFPELHIIDNEKWEKSGSGESLCLVPTDISGNTLVCYSDILFRRTVVDKILIESADVIIAYDSLWQSRYSRRSDENLSGCEKVIVNKGRVERIGRDVLSDWANGEFVGLARFSPEAIEAIKKLRSTNPENFLSFQLADCVEYLRIQGFSIAAVDVQGDWAEFNEARDIAHFVLGTKAETLRRLQSVVQNSIILDQVMFTVADWKRCQRRVLNRINKQFPNVPLVVRSSALSEDSFQSSKAGHFTSILNVKSESEKVDAICQVISSYGDGHPDDQILVQSMVPDVALSGVVFTRTLEHGAPWYVVNYESGGNTESITGGTSLDHQTMFLRRNCGADLTDIPDRRLANLIDAVDEIEGLLGYDDLDIEFAIDGCGNVYIFQVRPIAVQRTKSLFEDEDFDLALATAHNNWASRCSSPPHFPPVSDLIFGVMPDWNPAEIIGTSPSALAETLYRFLITDEVWATQRAEYGYRDVRPAPLLHSFAGRPYVDVRASFTSFIPASLSDDLSGRLLTFYLNWLRDRPELHDKVEFDVVPTCLSPGFESWKQRLQKHGFSNVDTEELQKALQKITIQAFDRTSADLESVNKLSDRYYKLMADEKIRSIDRFWLLLDDCRLFGTLPFAHLARSGFVAMNLLREAVSLGILSTEGYESFLSTVKTVSHELTEDALKVANGTLNWDAFVNKYGHLRPGTYDITSPRYDEDPERFLRPLVEVASRLEMKKSTGAQWNKEKNRFFAALKHLGLPHDADIVERFLHQAIEGREYAKFVFSRNLSSALVSLTEVGSALGLERSEIANIPLKEFLSLRNTSRSDQHTIEDLRQIALVGRKAQELAVACHLPPIITSQKDLDCFVIGADQPNFVGSGSVTAEIQDLTNAEHGSANNVSGKIVFIPQADPGYDWLFGHGIAGLVTLYGGANSHMAIRAAEFGLPAAIGIGVQRYNELAKGLLIELSPANGILRLV